MSWVESISCDTFLVYYGGHLCYDMSIPIATIVFYFYVNWKENLTKSDKLKKQW